MKISSKLHSQLMAPTLTERVHLGEDCWVDLRVMDPGRYTSLKTTIDIAVKYKTDEIKSSAEELAQDFINGDGQSFNPSIELIFLNNITGWKIIEENGKSIPLTLTAALDVFTSSGQGKEVFLSIQAKVRDMEADSHARKLLADSERKKKATKKKVL